ncbi:MAG TPA: hypothetical protein VK638_52030, partial [Edaphobacter sp.]|nr:hypothetical protein [Edaphobacter sp.]
ELVYVEEALRSGAAGYLLKSSAVTELKAAIDTVMRGGSYVTHLSSETQRCQSEAARPPAGR